MCRTCLPLLLLAPCGAPVPKQPGTFVVYLYLFLLGTVRAEEMFLRYSDLCLDPFLSLSSGVSSSDLVVQFLLLSHQPLYELPLINWTNLNWTSVKLQKPLRGRCLFPFWHFEVFDRKMLGDCVFIFLSASIINPHPTGFVVAADTSCWKWPGDGETHLLDVVKLLLHLMVDFLGLDQLLLDNKRCQITSSQSTLVRLNSIYCRKTVPVLVLKSDGKIDW